MGILERSARIVAGTEALRIHDLVDPDAEGCSELADGLGFVEAFSNIVALDTGAGLALFDTSHALFAPTAHAHLRRWTDAPVTDVVYTHGHVDHVTGISVFESEAAEQGRPPITVIGHEAIRERFDRYTLTNGYNGHINMRQFRLPEPTFPSDFRYPDVEYRIDHTVTVGSQRIELHHARGETDDHTWAWLPDHRAVCAGDLFIWQFPNAGNPQKVQRFAWEWAVALRAMAALEPELLLPAHGPALGGRHDIQLVLTETARAIESLHEQTLALMNAGARLDDVVHTVRLPDDLADRPWLQPTYDEPEFVVRNIWRLYGGWYDGNPAHLKPARDTAIAQEMATLAGGAEVLAARAESLAAADDLRLACHLAEMAVLAAPESARCHSVRAAVYDTRRRAERSFMASGIYRSAALDARERAAELSANET